jgi:hypothetical protein
MHFMAATLVAANEVLAEMAHPGQAGLVLLPRGSIGAGVAKAKIYGLLSAALIRRMKMQIRNQCWN